MPKIDKKKTASAYFMKAFEEFFGVKFVDCDTNKEIELDADSDNDSTRED